MLFSQEGQLQPAETSSKLAQSIFKRINLPVWKGRGTSKLVFQLCERGIKLFNAVKLKFTVQLWECTHPG